MGEMAIVSALLSHCSVLGCNNPMLSFRYQTSAVGNGGDLVSCKFVPRWIQMSKIQALHMERIQTRSAASSGGIYSGLKFDDEDHEDPFLLHFLKEAIRGLKSLLAFLFEQPGQLQYIEWPSFQDTLRTATLTLILVAMLIVALSSVDSALSYVLALLLRRRA